MSGYLELAQAPAPLLVIAAQLAGAAAALLIGHARWSWVLACIASLAAAWLALDLAARAFSGAVLPVAAEGVALTLDGAGLFGAALLASLAALVTLSAGALLQDLERRAAVFAIVLLMCAAAGWCGALFAADLVGVFIAVETAWLATVALTALSGETSRGALNGAMRMLSVGGGASMLMLLGVALTAHALGDTALANLPLAQTEAPGAAAAGAALIVFALALKAGVAPLHAWTGPAYGRAGGLAALALGVLGVAGALAVLVRLAAYAAPSLSLGAGVSLSLAALGGVSVVVASVQAIGASNIGRLAAYAFAAQAGCILLSAGLGSRAGFAAAFVQLFALAAAALALLGGAASGRVREIDMLDGLGRRAPLASAAITASALSLIGAPLTIGFLGRWRLVEAGVGAGWWWAAGAVVIASLAGVFYGGRLIERLYFRRASGPYQGGDSAWRLALAPGLAAAILAIALGLAPALLLNAAGAAAATLFGGGP